MRRVWLFVVVVLLSPPFIKAPRARDVCQQSG